MLIAKLVVLPPSRRDQCVSCGRHESASNFDTLLAIAVLPRACRLKPQVLDHVRGDASPGLRRAANSSGGQ
jgi:hypothetical protein